MAQTDEPLFEQLDDVQRVRVLAGLAIIAVAAGFLVFFVIMAGRIARWYINRQPRNTKPQGDPFASVVDSKPRPGRRESKNWQRR